MIKFIKLTEKCSDGSFKDLIVNTAIIQTIQFSNKGKDTHIRLVDKSFFFVTKKLSDIWLMLEPKSSEAASCS